MKFLEHYENGEYRLGADLGRPVLAFLLDVRDYRWSIDELCGELCAVGAGPKPEGDDVAWVYVKRDWIQNDRVRFVSTNELAHLYDELQGGVVPKVLRAINEASLPFGEMPLVCYSPEGLGLIQVTFRSSPSRARRISIEFRPRGFATICYDGDSGETKVNWESAYRQLDKILTAIRADVKEE